MDWVNKFLDKLGEVLELKSPGKVSWRYNEFEDWLLVAPSVLELAGGANDGESVYPFFALHVSDLSEIFDEPPELFWDTMNDEFSVQGKIDGDDAWITIFRNPFEDDEPDDIVDPNGAIRKKKPQIE